MLPLIEVKELDEQGNDTSFATHNQPCNQWTVQILAQANAQGNQQEWANSKAKIDTSVVRYEYPELDK